MDRNLGKSLGEINNSVQFAKTRDTASSYAGLALIPIAFISPWLCVILLLLLVKDQRHPVVDALVLATSAAVAVYGMQFAPDNDIVRHIALLPSYASVPFYQCFGVGHYGNLFVWDIWCWLVAKTGNVQLLQSSAAFVGYLAIGYIVFDGCARRKMTSAQTSCALLIAICSVPILPLVSGIRSSISVLICALSFYLYAYNFLRWWLSIAIMILAAMIHPVALFPIGFAVAAMCLKSSKRPFLHITVCFAIVLSIGIIGSLILPILPTSTPVGNYLSQAVTSLLSYQEGNSWTQAQSASFNSRVNALFNIIAAFVSLAASSLMLKNSAIKSPAYQESLFISFAAAGSLALLIVLPVNGARFLPVVFALAASNIVVAVRDIRRTSKNRYFVMKAFMFLLMMAGLLLHIYSVAYSMTDASAAIATLVCGVLGTYLY